MSALETYVFFLDLVRYETPRRTLSGADLKILGKVPPTYHLFIESRNTEQPDEFISDSQAIDLTASVPHIFAVPMATNWCG